MSTARLPVTLATRDYDFVAPLGLGDVVPEGLALTLIRAFDALERVVADPAVHGGEASFSQYARRVAAGDRAWVGLPVFVMREFRHRCFFVRRDRGLTDLAQLVGGRVGTDTWGASGNTWSRALLRERGLPVDGIQWLVGPVNPGEPAPAPGPLPPHARPAPAGRCLRDLLLAGDLDAVMCPWPPEGFYAADSPLTRLYQDYRSVEREYFRRTRLYPAHHLVVLKRELVERHPAAVPALYRAFREARARVDANHRVHHESSPWLLADLEEQSALMGPDYQADGYRENRAMVAAFCAEQHAQGLIAAPLDPDRLFADFERLTG
jgi:4,5-dihydroxyphthalate decarboxylase